jgi:ribosomal protein L22
MSPESPEQREDQPAEDTELAGEVEAHEQPVAEAGAAASEPAAEEAVGEPDAEAPASGPPGEAGGASKRRRSRRAAKKAQKGEQASEPQAAPEQREPEAERAAATAGGKPSAPAAEGGEKETATPARPAAAPRKAGARPRRRVVRARARYVRTPARKARVVCVHLPGKSVAQARAILAFTPRAVARDWSKLLESAVANAENNHELLEEDLVVREAYADEGPTIKRFRPRAMGRATPIRKRTSHLTITLTARRDTN